MKEERKMISLEINGKAISVPEGTSILDAAEQLQIRIPRLCKHPDLDPTAACGLCIVKIEGNNKMLRACCTPVAEGMKVWTHDPEVIAVRKTVLELILSNHPNSCQTCARNNDCELQSLAADFGIREDAFPRYVPELPKDASTGCIVLDPMKCIKCGRCVQVCQKMQNVWALSFLNRGIENRMAPAGDISLMESPCVKCGQCAAHCPTGAITEVDDTPFVWKALQDKDLFCTVQVAPAVRVMIAESFGEKPGAIFTRKLYAVLRRLGFDAVFDTNFGADLTIMEEASEFVERFVHQKHGPLPLITSCCPAWTDYMEKFHPDFIPHFSTAKSPQQMLGAMVKTYYAEKKGLDPKKIYHLSVMPCTAKKFEIQRAKDMYASGCKDIDNSITTRELVRMIRQAGIDFVNLPEEDPDSLLGEYTGAATIFGATGGVAEAAVRTAYYFITGKDLPEDKLDIKSLRGLDGIKVGEVEVAGQKVRVAVAHGLRNVQTVLDEVRQAKAEGKPSPYALIEVMACPGGCIGGGGQPYGVCNEVRRERIAGLYKDDRTHKIRVSHRNPEVQKLYKDFLGEPLSEQAMKHLHTGYIERPLYQK